MMVKAVLEEECVGPGLSTTRGRTAWTMLVFVCATHIPKYSYICHPLLNHIVIFCLGHTCPLRKTKGFSIYVVLSFCYNM